MRFTMVDHGYPYKKIMQGRKWVGRVVKHASESGYVGVIYGSPGHTACGATEREAFERVASLALGFKSPEAVRAHNSAVRQRNSMRRNTARHIVSEMLNGNFAPLDKLLGKTTVDEFLADAEARLNKMPPKED